MPSITSVTKVSSLFLFFASEYALEIFSYFFSFIRFLLVSPLFMGKIRHYFFLRKSLRNLVFKVTCVVSGSTGLQVGQCQTISKCLGL